MQKDHGTTTDAHEEKGSNKHYPNELFYSLFSILFGLIVLGLVASLAYDWLQG